MIFRFLPHDRAKGKEFRKKKNANKSAKRLFERAKKGVKKRGSHRPIEKCREKNAEFLVKMLAFWGESGYNKNTGCGKQTISARKSHRVVYSFADTARTPHGDENETCGQDTF
ncbi:MAG: hypothetical protein HDT27_07470, partial [Subdoligranulum sp.]|nr:hypothetical protein [Subdoligranulum sp.]